MQISSNISVAQLLSAGSNKPASAQGLSAEKTEKSDAFELTLSDEAKEYMATGKLPANAAKKSEGIENAPKTWEELTSSVKEQMKSVEDKLNRLFLSHGIDTSSEMEFNVDENGKIVLKSDHPNKEKIEEMLNSEEYKDFASEIKKMLSTSSMQAAGEVQQKYAISLDDDENKDDEEKQLALHQKAIVAQEKVAQVSGSFSLNSGVLSVASLDMAASIAI